MTSFAALVPMRHYSQRVPEKNYRVLGGKPLYHHILYTLMGVPQLTGIYVNTDSEIIKDGIQKTFPSINVIDRPLDLRDPEISMNRIIAHDMSLVEADYYLQTHSTNPLLKSETFTKAITDFTQNLTRYDSLFSVTRLQTRLYDSTGQAINHNPDQLIQTQDLPPVYEENSCIYIFSKDSFQVSGHRIGNNPMLFEIIPSEAWDIDSPLDFDIVDFLMGKSDE